MSHLYPDMSIFSNTFRELGSSIINIFKSFQHVGNILGAVLDIAVIAYIIYHAIRLIRETRAMQLLKGVAAIIVVYFIANLLDMITLQFLIRILGNLGLFSMVVLFQPELRSALEKVGRTQLSMFRFGPAQLKDEASTQRIEALIDVLVKSCVNLSAQKTGALIVIERKTRLGEVIATGTLIDSVPSEELIGNLFFVNSPLHDGAMVIRGVRLHAAGCYLPLSQNMEIGRELGTRHRAALGMSEVSDAVVIVVSEETGAITIASDARLQRGLSEKNLRKLLQIKLMPAADKDSNAPKPLHKKWEFWKVKS